MFWFKLVSNPLTTKYTNNWVYAYLTWTWDGLTFQLLFYWDFPQKLPLPISKVVLLQSHLSTIARNNVAQMELYRLITLSTRVEKPFYACKQHSLIISREVLILTLSILPSLEGCISWYIPWYEFMMREWPYTASSRDILGCTSPPTLRFPSSLRKFLGRRGCTLYNPIHPSSRQCTDTIHPSSLQLTYLVL